MTNPNYPAYPVSVIEGEGWKSERTRTYEGMTIRQRFVMAAMQGLAPRSATGSAEWIAAEAVRLADAALAEEAKTRGEQ